MVAFLFYHLVTIGILGSTVEAQAQFKLVPKFVKKKTPLEQFLLRKVSFQSLVRVVSVLEKHLEIDKEFLSNKLQCCPFRSVALNQNTKR